MFNFNKEVIVATATPEDLEAASTELLTWFAAQPGVIPASLKLVRGSVVGPKALGLQTRQFQETYTYVVSDNGVIETKHLLQVVEQTNIGGAEGEPDEIWFPSKYSILLDVLL